MATPRYKRISLPDGFYPIEEYLLGGEKFKELGGALGHKHIGVYAGFNIVNGKLVLVLCGDKSKSEPVVAVTTPAPTVAPKPKPRKKPAKKPGRGLWGMGSAELRALAKEHGVDWPVGVKKQAMVPLIRDAIEEAE